MAWHGRLFDIPTWITFFIHQSIHQFIHQSIHLSISASMNRIPGPPQTPSPPLLLRRNLNPAITCTYVHGCLVCLVCFVLVWFGCLVWLFRLSRYLDIFRFDLGTLRYATLGTLLYSSCGRGHIYIHLSICPFIYSFIHSFIYLFYTSSTPPPAPGQITVSFLSPSPHPPIRNTVCRRTGRGLYLGILFVF